MPPPPLLQRLKERELGQVALTSSAGAFMAFQAVEVLAEPWGISQSVQRTIHLLMVLGLYVTLVLTWYPGEKGRQHVWGMEILILTVLLVLAGAALTPFPGWGDPALRIGGAQPPHPSDPKIAHMQPPSHGSIGAIRRIGTSSTGSWTRS